jgi:hypothetical protein
MPSNFRKRWRALWQPDMYHGWGHEKRYFEGWYFKFVLPEQQAALAIIPGISKDEKGKQHAFIQVLDGVAAKAYYHEFSADEFLPDPQRFALQLGNNYFSGGRVRLNLPELEGELTLENPHPWPKMLGAPGIMGWYSFVPFMQCYHGVVSLHHTLNGKLRYQGRSLSFNNAIGYCEKDWGRSFPSSWIWMQSNHFDDLPEPTCLMVSVARIPWLARHFVGFIGGFLYKGELHRFATYTGAKLNVQLVDGHAHLQIGTAKTRLEIIGKPGPGADLVSPISGEMTGKVNESLQGQLELKFYKNGSLVYTGTGRHAGLELAGDIAGELAD